MKAIGQGYTLRYTASGFPSLVRRAMRSLVQPATNCSPEQAPSGSHRERNLRRTSPLQHLYNSSQACRQLQSENHRGGDRAGGKKGKSRCGHRRLNSTNQIKQAHRLLTVVGETGQEPGPLYWTRRRRHHPSAARPTLCTRRRTPGAPPGLPRPDGHQRRRGVARSQAEEPKLPHGRSLFAFTL